MRPAFRIFVALAITYIISYGLIWKKSEQMVTQQVFVWESELARRLLADGDVKASIQSEKGDQDFLKKILNQMIEIEPSLVAAELTNSQGVTTAQVDMQTVCPAEIRKELKLYAVPAGWLRACRSSVAMATEAVFSPFFLVFGFFIVFMGSFLYWREQSQLLVQKNLENEILSQQKIAQIARSIAHDIRGPLSALQVLLGHTSIGDEKEMLQIAADRINGLAEGLLLQAKIYDETKTEEPTEIGKVLQTLVVETRLRFPQTKIELRLPQEGGPLLKISKIDFERVVANFLTNAAEVSSGDRQIWVVVENVNGRVCVSITDQGQGIEPELLRVLGQQNVQSTKANGNGLGIKGAYELMARSGGRIEISSQLGVGTRVDLYLP